MRRLIPALLLLASPAWGLTGITAYKTFTREVLTSDDLNSSFTTVISGVNSALALHPGDSTKTTYGAFDTLVAIPGPRLFTVSPIHFRDNADSLVVPGRASIDTVKVNDQLWVGSTVPIVGFSASSTAGTRVSWAYSRHDTLVADTLLINTTTPIIGFSAAATAGTRVLWTYISSDTIATDSLTVLGPIVQTTGNTLTAGRIHPDSVYIGATPVVSFAHAQTSGTKMYAAYASLDSIATDSLTVIGPSNFAGEHNVLTASNWQLASTAFTGSMANLNASVDNSMADALHRHSELSASDGTPDGNFTMSSGGDATLANGYTLAAGRVHSDSVYIGGIPVVGFSHAQTGGTKMHAAYASLDSIATDSLTVIGPSNFVGEHNVLTASNWQLASTAFTGSMAELNTLTDASSVTTEHYHSDLAASDANPTNTIRLDATGDVTVDHSRQFFQSPRAKLVTLDTTIGGASDAGGNGSAVIYYNLHDPRTVWNYAAFRALEANSSVITTEFLSPMPAEGLITINTIQDSVVIWDLANGTQWMVSTSTGGAYVPSGFPITSLSFLDGVLRWGSGGSGLATFDFLRDVITRHSTSGLSIYNGGISTRNAEKALTLVGSSNTDKVVNSTINAVSAIRDPGGLKMLDGSGRLAQWWAVGTDGGASAYNPYDNFIYDISLTNDFDALALTSRGGIVSVYDDATRDQVRWKRTILDVAADSWADNEVWINTGAGSEDIDWATGTVFSDLIVMEGASAAGTNADKFVFSSSEGLYVAHAKANDNQNGAKILITNALNSPYAVGDAVGVFSLAGTAEDSPYNNVLTNVNSAGFTAAVFGNGYSSTVNSYLKREGDSDFNDPRSVALWFKSASTTNPSAPEALVFLEDEVGATDHKFYIHLNTSGQLYIQITDGSTSDSATGGADVYDTNWHHAAVVLRTTSFDAYLDGTLHAQDASLAITIGNVNTDTLAIGARHTGGAYDRHFTGQIDQVVVSKDELTAAEIRYMYERGVRAQESDAAGDDGLADNGADIDFLCADPYSGMWAAGNEDSLMIFDGYDIPVRRHATPGGAMADCALWTDAGADSVSIAMVGATGLQIIRPDVLVSSALAHRWAWEQPLMGHEVIADSSGRHGLFWHITDALDAADISGRSSVYAAAGTYPKVDITPPGMSLRGEPYDPAGGAPFTLIDGTTIDDAIDVSATGDGAVIRDLAVQTTAGQGNDLDGIRVRDNAAKVTIDNVSCIDSDDDCFSFYSAGAEGGVVRNSFIYAADDRGTYADCPRIRYLGNWFGADFDGAALELGGGGDNSVINSNIVEEVTAGDGITIHANAENNVCVGNLTNTVIVDNSGTSKCGTTFNEEY